MIIDKNDFFRQMTLTICGSLDFKAALQRVFDYLSPVFPVREIILSIADKQLQAAKMIANASAGSGRRDDSFPLSDDFWEWLRTREVVRAPAIVNDQLVKSLHPDLIPALGHDKKHSSEMLVPMILEDINIGLMALFAPKGFDYQQEHLDLICSVADPFALALSNAIAYQHMIQRQNILEDDNEFFQKELIRPAKVIGERSGLKDVMDMVNNVAPMHNTVMISGETGVGKEIIANAIHQRSKRRNGPFIKVNCGAIPEQLVDSELFGHEKGAFTGAAAMKRGRFERADGGTIFLDEVGELSLSAQVRLLRVLANREIERVGGTQVIPLNIRIITATHRDLKEMVKEGKFREDLWFRLNVFPIVVPPLRYRKEDIPELTEYFLEAKSRELGIAPPSASALGLRRLTAYGWPGNVRELENVIEREMICSPYQKLDFSSLKHSPDGKDEADGALPGLQNQLAELLPLEELNIRYIQKVLRLTNGKVSGPDSAADILQINPGTLRSRMLKYKINRFGEKR